jgi:hypothetical protein
MEALRTPSLIAETTSIPAEAAALAAPLEQLDPR